MRRLVTESPSFKSVVLLALIIALASLLGALYPAGAQPSPEPAASPAAVPTPEVAPIGIMKLPPVGDSQFGNILYLTQVTFGPNVPAPDTHTHSGQFVLTVDSGAVCYELESVVAEGTMVTAVIPLAASDNSACGGTQVPDCDDDDTAGIRNCTLVTGDIIYLPAGSSLTQTGDTIHTYGNIDDEPAVVYLAGHEEDRPGAGCRGGCL